MNSFFLRIFVIIIIYSSIFDNSISQDAESIIELKNPSFEDPPMCCKVPSGWINCGWPNQSPPDIQPAIFKGEPLFGVTTKAYHGKTYLGMVTRNDGSFERISQSLSMPLRKGKCYRFSIYLCTSEEYISASVADKHTLKLFDSPIKLRIYAGKAYCNLTQMLNESKEIVNSKWEKHIFEFQPNDDYEFIELIAFYLDHRKPVDGNILLDNASHIQFIPCE